MLFMVTYEVKPELRDTVQDRFRSIGEGMPKGAKLLGHWESVTQLEGWGLVETDDPVELFKLFHKWTNLNVNHIAPVLEAKAIRKALGS